MSTKKTKEEKAKRTRTSTQSLLESKQDNKKLAGAVRVMGGLIKNDLKQDKDKKSITNKVSRITKALLNDPDKETIEKHKKTVVSVWGDIQSGKATAKIRKAFDVISDDFKSERTYSVTLPEKLF